MRDGEGWGIEGKEPTYAHPLGHKQALPLAEEVAEEIPAVGTAEIPHATVAEHLVEGVEGAVKKEGGLAKVIERLARKGVRLR